jgi:Domain of unknown function (DUF4476)
MKTFLVVMIFTGTLVFAQNKESHINHEKDPGKLIHKISKNLETLEREYLTKLSYRDYVKAKDILIETYDLLLAIPVPKPHGEHEIEGPVPMSEEDFSQLIESIKNESFEDDQLSIVELSSRYNFYTVSQVVRVINEFSYSSGQLKSLELLYPKVVDPNNSSQILNAFSYSSDKEKAKEIINRK